MWSSLYSTWTGSPDMIIFMCKDFRSDFASSTQTAIGFTHLGSVFTIAPPSRKGGFLVTCQPGNMRHLRWRVSTTYHISCAPLTLIGTYYSQIRTTLKPNFFGRKMWRLVLYSKWHRNRHYWEHDEAASFPGWGEPGNEANDKVHANTSNTSPFLFNVDSKTRSLYSNFQLRLTLNVVYRACTCTMRTCEVGYLKAYLQ